MPRTLPSTPQTNRKLHSRPGAPAHSFSTFVQHRKCARRGWQSVVGKERTAGGLEGRGWRVARHQDTAAPIVFSPLCSKPTDRLAPHKAVLVSPGSGNGSAPRASHRSGPGPAHPDEHDEQPPKRPSNLRATHVGEGRWRGKGFFVEKLLCVRNGRALGRPGGSVRPGPGWSAAGRAWCRAGSRARGSGAAARTVCRPARAERLRVVRTRVVAGRMSAMSVM